MKLQLQGARRRWRGITGAGFYGACAAVLAVAAGCATKVAEVPADASPEVKAAVVRERASARWAELIKGDTDAAYAYLSPGARQMVSREQFSARMRGTGFRAVQVDKVDCEADVCTVRLQVTYDYRSTRGAGAAKGITTTAQETWVVEKGQAWFVMRP